MEGRIRDNASWISVEGDPTPDRFERGVIVFEGEIMGARVDQGALRELSVTPQSSVGFVGTPVEFTIPYTNKRVGIGTDEIFARPRADCCPDLRSTNTAGYLERFIQAEEFRCPKNPRRPGP